MESEGPNPGGQSPAQSSGSLPDVAAALAAIGAALQSLAAALHQGKPAPRALPHAPQPAALDSVPLARAVNEFLVYQARLARSDRYLRQLRVVFSSLVRARGACLVSDLTPSDVRRWVESPRWSPGTARRYAADARAFLEWCRRRGWCHGNAAEDVRIPKVRDTRPPAIHTPEQARAVLEACRCNPDVLRQVAIRYFCGLRSSEAAALREEDLNLEDGHLVVPAAKAKTRRRRAVSIPPNLREWLALGGTLRGIRPATVRAVMHAAGVPCPPNVTRHSWVSYHLALHQSAARTAMEAGHAEAVLFAHYRALVTSADAARYFSLTPSAPAPSA